MDDKFLKEQKAKLLDEKSRLQEELGVFADSKNSGHYEAKYENLGDTMEDNALELSMYQQNISIEKDLESVLRKIESAISRIENKTYGKCTEGDDIEPERLKVIPWAETCIKHSK